MSLKKSLIAASAAVSLTLSALPVFAGSEIAIEDAFARSSSLNAMAGAAFMHIVNSGDEDDRMIGARSDVAKVVELHTHIESAEGVMQMVEVEEGFPVAAGGMHMLVRGADHVMFMGLNQPFIHGNIITVTLIFEKAGEITVEIPVDLERKPMEGSMDHGMSNSDSGG
ncbi:MAG: copper chaperone PCu(A)C [Rhodobacteraceae bacterium]|nr:copper chaperone PCu(A)C [Paracoccaceae bacterium]